jgi:hypothetical protein
MEYYEGLFFLTTNRVGVIDEAVLSRIHITLHYPEFDNEMRQELWRVSFAQLKKSRPAIHVTRGAKSYCTKSEDIRLAQLNGREIVNTLNTAVKLAEQEHLQRVRREETTSAASIDLEDTHIRAVIETRLNFAKYMSVLTGGDQIVAARAREFRRGHDDTSD